jgi:CRP-like cAMP-binding protein/AmiR/NasT family two-component response regulator
MKKILLIEDDKVVRENTAEILELAHYQVSTAEHGKKGVQLVKEFSPELIICDIMMPELDGYGVLHILSKDPTTAGIPFIFLTAKAEKSEVRKGMELGADDYLTKPFEETELLNAIETRLRKNEFLKKEFSKDLNGLDQFFDEAKGVADLEKLSQKRPIVHYKKKDMIFQEGDPPHHLFFLVKGKVKTFKVHDDGKEYVTGLYGKGDFFGYIPLLEKSEYEETATAMEDSEVCKIPKDDFINLVYQNRDVSTQFIKMLSNNVVERERQLLSLAYDTVRKRVAEALLLLAKRFLESGKKPSRLSIHRDDLASMAGTATETVIRVLSDFKSDKYIDIEGRDIILLNREGLEEIQ